MNVVSVLFYVFMSVAAFAAGAILFSKNVFKSALLLLICLLSVAALYVLSSAEFLAVTQILIYAGGILVIIIFGIMLTTRISGKPLVVAHANLVAGTLAGAGFLTVLLYYLPASGNADEGALESANMRETGLLIFSTYALPFEIAGILLLIALIGAAVLTSHLKSRT